MLRCWHTSSVKADDAFVTDILMTHVLSCRYLYNYATIIPNSASFCKHRCRDRGACAVLGPHTMFVWFVTTTVLCKTHVGTGLALSCLFSDDSPNYRMRDAFNVGTGLAPVLFLICLSWFVLPCPGSFLKMGLVR